MNQIWLYTIASVLIVSLVSLVGAITLSISISILKKILLFLVSFAAGALLGDAFIHLLPEAVSMREAGFTIEVSLYILLGIIVFFVLEKFLRWRHCHIPTSKEHPHPLAAINLVGDAFHNFTDGMIIAGSYMVSLQLGMATTLAVVLHEIPQEIGDFGVLLHAGMKKTKALFYNFLSAMVSVIGAVFALVVGSYVDHLSIFLVPFTAGGFIYIAGSDLIPELHKESAPLKSFIQLVSILAGFVVMLALLWVE